MRVEACVMLCTKCRQWTSYKSSKGGVKRIDTQCKVCGVRLRHTHNPKPFTTFQNTKMRWGRVGSGGYQTWSSIKDLIQCNPNECNKLASEMNKRIQERRAKVDGKDLKTLEDWEYYGR
jgi:hypothetical protein